MFENLWQNSTPANGALGLTMNGLAAAHLFNEATAAELFSSIERIVRRMRQLQTFTLPDNIPLSALVLASLRFQSPLPPELWRGNAFSRPNQ